MALKLRKESALNLTLEGSIGSFSVGTGIKGQNSIEVKYFLTHVGLDFSTGSNEALLSYLAPVREIFNLNQLDFDEIMQRDIDDARVSSELIPYLLDNKSIDLVKLFPPIVVVVLPIQEGENRPDKLYGKVVEEEKAESNEEEGQYILRAGSIGQEIFQFEQPISDGERLKHDLVRFRLNTHKTRLVIVDGQHRAMALLALYRNLKDQWSDEKRAPFKDYYSEWTPRYIKDFNLKEINLPIILCTFPSLDEQYSGEFDLLKAARSVFLTLNRNARKVSRTRNILLDDNDIIAYLLRCCLSKVKQKDKRSLNSLRLFNIELDQSDKDRLKLESPIALTGVSHLYYVIEHLLLNNGIGEGAGIKARSGNFAKRKDLNAYPFMERLNGRNLLGDEVARATKRDNFTTDIAEELSNNFSEKYGKFIIQSFEDFFPYENHNKAVLNLEQSIETDKDRKLKPILFEGQGIGRVFETHRENLKIKIKDTDGELSQVPEIQSILKGLDATAERVENQIENFRRERVELYLKPIADKAKLRNTDGIIKLEVVKYFNELYDNILTTVAFQSGLICGFFGEIEKTITKNGQTLNVEKCFDEYIQQLNDFFVPKSFSQFKKIVRVFKGEILDEDTDWKITPTNQTFRQVVYRGEMQPDQWTKYKYLLLEIWKPTNESLRNIINEEREQCREQIFSALYNSYKATYCRDNSKLEENLDPIEFEKIFEQSLTAYNGFLKNVGAEKLEEQKMKEAASKISAVLDESEDEE
jgi:hypothetical protein